MERIYVSQIVRADADAVWAVVRDFNGLPDWHPAIADSAIENDRAADSVGCVRSFHLTDGGHIREQLTGLSDPDRRMDYIILESPMPVSDYRARIEVRPVTEDKASFVAWTAAFEVTDGEPATTRNAIADGVFRAGLAALDEKFG